MAKNKSWFTPVFNDNISQPVKRTRSHVPDIDIDSSKMYSDYGSSKRNRTNDLSAILAKCEPTQSSEVVVSRQKQQDISMWLCQKARAGQPAAAVICGPSGCGKTSTVKVLAKEHNFDVVEWITPIDQIADENNIVTRQGDKFEEYLIRTTRYNSIFGNSNRRLALVKDFPNVYFYDKDSFYSLLEKYFQMGKEPVIFICSDSGNSKMLQTLFPQDIRDKHNIDLININSVTQTAMKKALKRISEMWNSMGSSLLHVSQHNIDEILSNNIGDIRNAILNLIFVSLKVPKVEGKSDCGIREESLGLLHGVGRVINPKRIVDGDSWKFVHNPDDIAAVFQSQTTVFIHFIHENYLNTIGRIEEADNSADSLSVADVLSSEWRDNNLNKATLSFCVRGVMVGNEKPVSGWNPVRKPQRGSLELRRNLADAEFHWYGSIIDPSKKKSNTIESEKEIHEIIE